MQRLFPGEKICALMVMGIISVDAAFAQPRVLAMGSRGSQTGGSIDWEKDIPAASVASPGPGATKRFAADQVHFHPPVVPRMVDLRFGLAEMHMHWGVIEPKAPVNGVASYRGKDALDAEQRQFLKDFAATDLALSLVIESFGNKWAFEFSDKISVKSPVSGKQLPGFVRLKPEHRQDWKNFITHLLTTMPNVQYIQMDNEPENVWVSGPGYLEALRLAYEAVQEYNTREGKQVKVMAAGFALGPDVIRTPEPILRHIQQNHPNVDVEWIRQQAKLPAKIPARQIFHTSQKFHVILSVLLSEDAPFDILTIHNDWARSSEEAETVIGWYRNVLRRGGNERPIWIDDMHAAYYPKVRPQGTPADVRIYEALAKNNAQAIQRYNEEQSAWLVKKTAWNFAAGAERLKIAPLVDMPYYFMPVWRYAGLFTEDFKPKPSFYSAQLLMQKIDYFKSVTQLKGDVYRFTFDHKDDVFIAWAPKSGGEIDASRHLGPGQVRITYLVREVDRNGRPVIRPPVQVPTSRIPLSEEPVFIERVR